MLQIPRDPALDSTLAMMREGYEFIWNRCRSLETDIFVTRIMGRRAVCIHGVEAAEVFYDETKFRRKGALPRRVVTSLFGKTAVHTLDDEAHRNRKAAFLALMTPASLERLTDVVARHWRDAIRSWESATRVVLFDEAERVLAAGVCEWAGVPLRREEVARRAHDFGAMVDAFGGVGPRLWKGKIARARAEHWMTGIVERVRRGELSCDRGSVLDVMTRHRDLGGELLPARTAAVEVLNVTRPTVAISWYVVFAALALHEHPEARDRIAADDVEHDAGDYTDLFVQEVRRFYPFTPYLGAMVRAPFEWRGCRFAPETLVLLDVYGNNHDPRIWERPDEFRPERFRRWSGDAFSFIPQGGGQRAAGHRCPGEWITMHNLALALHFLVRCTTFDVRAGQDLSFDLRRMPTRPRSGFVIEHARANARLAAEAPHAPSRTAARDSAAADDVAPAPAEDGGLAPAMLSAGRENRPRDVPPAR